MLSVVTGQLWEGAGKGSGMVFIWGLYLSALFLPISPLNTLSCQGHVPGEGYREHLCSEWTFCDWGLIKQADKRGSCFPLRKRVARCGNGQRLMGKRKVKQIKKSLGFKMCA